MAVVAFDERRHAVLAHIGRHGEGIDVIFFEERAGIHLAGVAYVAPLGVGNDELVGIVLLQVLHRLLERHEAFHASRLIEGEIRLEGYAIGRGGVDDGAIEREDGVFLAEQVPGYLL